jgi:4-amino-4-deoxy-L-arabinose transferase-like glycosyltransferase
MHAERQPDAVPPHRRDTARDVVWLVLLGLLLYLPFLGARDLWNPNEPLYGQAVVEMAARGDWSVPTVNGEVFAEKPILYFWLALSAAKLLGGVHEAALRLPSVLAAVAGLVLVYLLVLPYTDRVRARGAAALFGTTYIILWTARWIQMDLLLTVCSLAAVVAATRVLDHGLEPWRGWALAGGATGLGFLTKGPVGVVTAALPVVVYVLWSRRGRVSVRRELLGGAVAFVVVASPWFLALWLTGRAEMLDELFVRQNVARALAPWDHQAPWWYFLRELWTDMAPWAPCLVLAVGLAPEDDRERELHRLGWAWLVGLVFFFSLFPSKRSTYIMPVAPAVAVLASAVAVRYWRGALTRPRRLALVVLVAMTGAVMLAGGVAAWHLALPRYPALGVGGYVFAATLASCGAAVLATATLRRRAAPLVLGGAVVVLDLLAVAWVVPAVDAYKSPRAFCERVNEAVSREHELYAYRIWRWRAGYTYFTGRPVRRIETAAELESRWKGRQPFHVIVERGMLDEARAVIGEVEPMAARAIGSNFAYLFVNAPGTATRTDPLPGR